MNTEVLPLPTDDAAWASFKTPLSETELREFCEDIERLYRINPYLEFSQWRSTGTQQYHFSGKNISQEPAFEFALDLRVEHIEDGIRVHYAQGLKSSTTFKIEAAPEGSQLTIIEDYSQLPEEEREARLHEVDRSLVKWANDIQAYLIHWNNWSRFGLWRWYMRRIWQPLKPMSRRIVYILLWITVVEIALILLGAAIFWVEYT
ncbi:hypothetical protein [Kaarinaea lacus]